MSGHIKRLSTLKVGQQGQVSRVEAEDGIQRRLLEMGFVRGENVTVLKLAPLGDPMELVLKGYHLSLRRSESACIFVEVEA